MLPADRTAQRPTHLEASRNQFHQPTQRRHKQPETHNQQLVLGRHKAQKPQEAHAVLERQLVLRAVAVEPYSLFKRFFLRASWRIFRDADWKEYAHDLVTRCANQLAYGLGVPVYS